MSEKFQTPRGTRDFLPEEMILRERVFDTVKSIFQRWGFDPFKTPAFENYELFAMKESIGEGEADKLYVFEDKSGRKLSLRFDQTVPFCRQMASNPQLPKPVRRYEISRVWRYEEIKRGKYREFWQCDCDTAGAKSMLADAEVIAIVLEVLEELGFKGYMRVNNRKLLTAIIEDCGVNRKKVLDAYRAIDKLDKIGKYGVRRELDERGIGGAADKIMEILEIDGKPEEVLEKIKDAVKTKDAEEGIRELGELVGFLKDLGKENVIIDLSLARGLDYYTSTIFEAMSDEKSIGSLAGGGRYDRMIGAFAEGREETPSVGFGLGVERIIDLLKDRDKVKRKTYTKVFVVNVSANVKKDCLKLAQELRGAGISTQVDVMDRPLRKQLEYINSLGIPYAVIVGENEVKSGKFKLKNMATGEEIEVTGKDLSGKLKGLF
ncbi:histidine--tRNA ligase [Candidatus Micrarchaeota archaeon RBG_16_49_10]|nr:MAG: histidine--tRNA ligase [Candidatus Micrarchaeota archaeon RBG_16_49_10]